MISHSSLVEKNELFKRCVAMELTGEVAYSGIGSRISQPLVEFLIQLHLSLKSDCRRDPQSTVCSPSPI